ncbi:MAG: hypothetical protein Q7N50_04450 [Armatimonadota bacterium]|nr:hypothetical protein [Armatimonadota bacterium]
MALLRRKRKKIEGWNEPDARDGRLTRLKESIRGSNRAWVICFTGVIVLGVGLLIVTAQREQFTREKALPPPHQEHGVYMDSAHRKFVNDFHRHIRGRRIDGRAKFVNSGRFQIIVPSDMSEDDIAIMSRVAARGILERFHNAPYVYVYTYDNKGPTTIKMIAETRWVKRRDGFEVRFIGAENEEEEFEEFKEYAR